jgi:4-amino-4-deoxychorismate lyase
LLSVDNASLNLSSVNGQLNASVSVGDRGLAFGDGVFETLRLIEGIAPLWRYHCERLQEGCRRLLIPIDLMQIERWVDELLQQHNVAAQNGVLKIIVTRGAGGRGYAIDPALMPTVVCSLHPPPASAATPVDLFLCQHQLPPNVMLAGIKHLNRLDNILLKAECQRAGFEDGLVLDSAENVVETVSSNIFFEKQGELFTPELTQSGVAGVMRRLLLEELAPELGVKVHVAPIPLHSLSSFCSAFSCNSVRGITPIASINTISTSSTADSNSTSVHTSQTTNTDTGPLVFASSALTSQFVRSLALRRLGG